ncbi:rod-binding protein [uncultured Novosphingobium sp.]|uniref:rod-binding protein n=1 Tax=uncultured Novosphingobium sp. TaxID=292277 RepID=UPI0007377D59|nr:rod-binding protein [uncultured Novosphingobium sp.]KTR82271.1 flagellar rod assembly protein FlgJ [Novosphingobium barchaimii]
MTSISAPNLATTKLVAGNATQREKLSASAKQFEAIFVRQMLSAARKADFGGDDLFGGQALDTFREMQDNQFADIAAQTGSLGFAAKIEAQVARLLPHEANAPATPKGAK